MLLRPPFALLFFLSFSSQLVFCTTVLPAKEFHIGMEETPHYHVHPPHVPRKVDRNGPSDSDSITSSDDLDKDYFIHLTESPSWKMKAILPKNLESTPFRRSREQSIMRLKGVRAVLILKVLSFDKVQPYHYARDVEEIEFRDSGKLFVHLNDGRIFKYVLTLTKQSTDIDLGPMIQSLSSSGSLGLTLNKIGKRIRPILYKIEKPLFPRSSLLHKPHKKVVTIPQLPISSRILVDSTFDGQTRKYYQILSPSTRAAYTFAEPYRIDDTSEQHPFKVIKVLQGEKVNDRGQTFSYIIETRLSDKDSNVAPFFGNYCIIKAIICDGMEFKPVSEIRFLSEENLLEDLDGKFTLISEDHEDEKHNLIGRHPDDIVGPGPVR